MVRKSKWFKWLRLLKRLRTELLHELRSLLWSIVVAVYEATLPATSRVLSRCGPARPQAHAGPYNMRPRALYSEQQRACAHRCPAAPVARVQDIRARRVRRQACCGRACMAMS